MNSQANQLNARIHWVINELSEDQLMQLWDIIAEMYYDTYLLNAIKAGKRSPGDSLTHDEALQFLMESGMGRTL